LNPLLPTKTFCILPWIHFFHEPNGEFSPCCSANKQAVSFGNLRDFATVDDIINSPAMRQVRKDMLADQQNPACANCYRQESFGIESFRLSKNNNIAESGLDQLLANTDADGTLHNFQIQYWDARFSNICNLKCRMCGPGYSHTWAQEENRKVNGSYIISAHDTTVWHDIISKYGDLGKLKEVYFAGGEVFFQQEHWLMLDHLRQLGMQHIRLTYVTNLTRLTMNQYNIEDYLTYFTNVLFVVSMDGVDSVFEYIRSGSNWIKFTNNLETVRKFNINIRFNIVVTIYNILSLHKVFDFIADNGFDKYDVTVANSPDYQVIANLPTELKDIATQRLERYPRARPVLNFMMQSPITNWSTVIANTNKLDDVRGENVLDVVPEFKPYWN
jgi:MoaA/NifB/PqqE/SkfB family radical SAM enzyme